MEFNNIIFAAEGGIARLTINRPDKLNALNMETLAEIHAAVDHVRDNAELRVLVITGAGEKAFVAGADISEIARLSAVDAVSFSRAGQDVMLAIENLGKPVIAAINGFALGGGCELAIACSLRIASENARLGQPEINLGITPGFGGTQRLLRLCGKGPTLELCLLGKPISASRAQDLGIVNQVVPAEALAETVDKIAGQLARSAPFALRGILEATNRGGECPIDQGLDYETHQFALCCSTDDMKEGTSAFLEKRKADFKGQ